MKIITAVLAIVPFCLSPALSSPDPHADSLAMLIRAETIRSWHSYERYAWGHDGFRPLSRKAYDWYSAPLGITLIDAYSTLSIMGFKQEVHKIEKYVADSISFDRDTFVKTFEVNIRILGGLLDMYELSQNPAILKKAEDFGKRLLPAFRSPTGIPYYWVNLKTGAVRGDTVNVAEGGTYLIEMGALSFFTGKPVYYQAAKRATKALYSRRSPLGLVAQNIDVRTGKWLDEQSHIGACIDSYYEYILKGWLLFRDPELKTMWDNSIEAINRYIADDRGSTLWYGVSSMKTGKRIATTVTLYDAFFAGQLTLAGDLDRAKRLQASWDRLWKKNGLEPMAYDYGRDSILSAEYDLNPEIIESAYYLYHRTGDPLYRQRVEAYFNDLERYCSTDAGFCSIRDVRTKEKLDDLPSFFFAETMKYFYLTFANPRHVGFAEVIFSTEAHPFEKAIFNIPNLKRRLGF